MCVFWGVVAGLDRLQMWLWDKLKARGLCVCVCVGGWECVCVAGSVQSCLLGSSKSDRQDRVGDKVADLARQKKKKEKTRKEGRLCKLSQFLLHPLNSSWTEFVVFILYFFRELNIFLNLVPVLPSLLTFHLFPFDLATQVCLFSVFFQPSHRVNIQGSPFIHWYFIHAGLCSCPDVSPWVYWCIWAVSNCLFSSYREAWLVTDPIYGSY